MAWWEEEPQFLTWFLGVDLYHINIKGYLCWSLLWAKCCYFSLLHCWSFFFAGSHKTKWVINGGKKNFVIFLHGFLILFLVIFFYNVSRTIRFLLRKMHIQNFAYNRIPLIMKRLRPLLWIYVEIKHFSWNVKWFLYFYVVPLQCKWKESHLI